ncbi:hypothetical protein RRG08_057182 [Elysia crispata]|uniref:Uncharacterized protein n=1 Tax=Elysia crispata TaxID=231223 RepID=A0AAE0XWK8_9GAST|nr:hypothetical protein RRG08_057182 [Elysia crispata]
MAVLGRESGAFNGLLKQQHNSLNCYPALNRTRNLFVITTINIHPFTACPPAELAQALNGRNNRLSTRVFVRYWLKALYLGLRTCRKLAGAPEIFKDRDGKVDI